MDTNVSWKVLGAEKVKSELRRIFETICEWKHWEIIELNIQEEPYSLLSSRHTARFSLLHHADSEREILCLAQEEDQTHPRSLRKRISLWARGYFVSTVGLDEHLIRQTSASSQSNRPTIIVRQVALLTTRAALPA
jgi:REP element-mobilizing transposase RayT